LRVQLVEVPFDSGQRDMRMGRGPAHLLELGAEKLLHDRGDDVSRVTVASDLTFPGEIAVAFDLSQRIAEVVRTAVADDRMPIILAGNCISSTGAVAALGSPAVVWFDAHGDFNTPETSVTGMLDGMALATLAGRCWQGLARTIPGFAPVPEENLVLVGARDIDDDEANLLRASEVAVVTAGTVRRISMLDALAPVLRALHARTQRVYLHIDLDVLDPSEGTANSFAAPHGLTLKQLLAAIRRIGEQFSVVGGALSAYDPALDEDGRAGQAALRVLEALVVAGEPH
jgi:arginase